MARTWQWRGRRAQKALAWQRRDRHLAGGVAALLLMPPLIGFTLGFLILHALPQTTERRPTICSAR